MSSEEICTYVPSPVNKNEYVVPVYTTIIIAIISLDYIFFPIILYSALFCSILFFRRYEKDYNCYLVCYKGYYSQGSLAYTPPDALEPIIIYSYSV